VPSEARLQRSAAAPTAASSAATDNPKAAAWDGVIVLQMPAR
jgi:hypothetical protein